MCRLAGAAAALMLSAFILTSPGIARSVETNAHASDSTSPGVASSVETNAHASDSTSPGVASSVETTEHASYSKSNVETTAHASASKSNLVSAGDLTGHAFLKPHAAAPIAMERPAESFEAGASWHTSDESIASSEFSGSASTSHSARLRSRAPFLTVLRL